MRRRGSSNSTLPVIASIVVLAAAGAGAYWLWSTPSDEATASEEDAPITVPLRQPANPEPDAADAIDRAKAQELAERIREAEANPDAVDIPTPSGSMDDFERALGDAHPGVVVENKECDPAVCVFALRIEDPSDEAARVAVITAAQQAGMEMEAQPTFRWEEDGDEVVGFMWLMPHRLTPEESAALIKRAETHVTTLGG